MTRLALIICFLYSISGDSQTAANFPWDDKDFKASYGSLSCDSFNFKNLKITLIHINAENGVSQKNGTNNFSCRVWLTVKQNNKLIDKRVYMDCNSVGGCSGIFVAKRSNPIKNYFILSKFGDYDGQLILIDSTGKITEFIGGDYSVSDNQQYLFSSYSSDLSGLTVFDLSNGKVLFTKQLKEYLADFYFFNNQYFSIISDDVKTVGKTRILVFDLTTNQPLITTVIDDFIKKAQKLKSYNNTFVSSCNCGKG